MAKGKMSLPERRIWQFQGPIICRILGLTFDEEEASKIFRKLKFDHSQQIPTAQIHGALVQACTSSGPVAKYVDKMLKERFEPYQRVLKDLDQRDICRFIEEGEGPRDVPLAALTWFAVRNQREDIEEIENRIFHAIHMKEHRAVRLYDELSRTLPIGRIENVAMELREALASRKELERRYDRAKQEKERLRSEMESLKEEKASLALALTKQRELNQQLTTDLEQLGGELILHEIEKLRKERELLAKEIEDLTQELLRQEFCEAAYKSDTCPMCLEREAQDEPVAPTQVEKQQDIPFSLEDRRVAFVGGLDSLVPYYQQIVECLGGIFCNHCGESSQGKKEIQSLVDRADVVFCPVDINSHNACRCVKKACKLTGKPCHFLRSSSLSMLRRELISFAQRRTEA